MSSEKQPASTSNIHMTGHEDGHPLTQTVLEAVAAISNRPILPDDSSLGDGDPMPLPPLYEVIDPEALNLIFQSATDENDITVTFTYCGYDVAVTNGDEVMVFEDR